jgi:hypothetical protein
MRLVRGYAISANGTIGSKKRVGGGFSQAREKAGPGDLISAKAA